MGSYSDLATATVEERESAKRLSDTINGIVAFTDLETVVHRWIAVRLRDGQWTGDMYDSRSDAVRLTSNGDPCAYLSLRFCPAGMEEREAFAWLRLQRDAYSARDIGIRLVDPEATNGGHDFMMPITNEEVRREINNFRRRVANRKGRR